jgi:hypothetical protein
MRLTYDGRWIRGLADSYASKNPNWFRRPARAPKYVQCSSKPITLQHSSPNTFSLPGRALGTGYAIYEVYDAWDRFLSLRHYINYLYGILAS